MTVHKTYIVDGKEYEASGYTEKRADGTIWKTRYSIYCEGSGRGGYIGEVHELHYRHGIGYRIVGWDSIVNVENQCTSLEEAVTALVLELDRRAARRKATQVSWGDVIVPRIEAWDTRDGKVRHVVYDTGHPDDMSVGEVTEIAPGKWKAQLNLGYPWGGPPSPSATPCRLRSKTSSTSSRRTFVLPIKRAMTRLLHTTTRRTKSAPTMRSPARSSTPRFTSTTANCVVVELGRGG